MAVEQILGLYAEILLTAITNEHPLPPAYSKIIAF
jgi:hypothetical protein